MLLVESARQPTIIQLNHEFILTQDFKEKGKRGFCIQIHPLDTYSNILLERFKRPGRVLLYRFNFLACSFPLVHIVGCIPFNKYPLHHLSNTTTALGIYNTLTTTRISTSTFASPLKPSRIWRPFCIVFCDLSQRCSFDHLHFRNLTCSPEPTFLQAAGLSPSVPYTSLNPFQNLQSFLFTTSIKIHSR